MPPIEVYKDDYPTSKKETFETELTTKDILFKYVLNNKWVWAIAFANIFVYFVRYGVLDWAPTYLSEEKVLILKALVGLIFYMNGLEYLAQLSVVIYLIKFLKDVVDQLDFCLC